MPISAIKDLFEFACGEKDSVTLSFSNRSRTNFICFDLQSSFSWWEKLFLPLVIGYNIIPRSWRIFRLLKCCLSTLPILQKTNFGIWHNWKSLSRQGCNWWVKFKGLRFLHKWMKWMKCWDDNNWPEIIVTMISMALENSTKEKYQSQRFFLWFIQRFISEKNQRFFSHPIRMIVDLIIMTIWHKTRKNKFLWTRDSLSSIAQIPLRCQVVFSKALYIYDQIKLFNQNILVMSLDFSNCWLWFSFVSSFFSHQWWSYQGKHLALQDICEQLLFDGIL